MDIFNLLAKSLEPISEIQFICKHYLRKKFPNDRLDIYGSIQHEEKNGLNIIYFESRSDDMSKDCKRYHMIVYDMLCIEIYFEDSNVIDIDKGYDISKVKESCKVHLNYILKKIE
jgi:hypothetical protein